VAEEPRRRRARAGGPSMVDVAAIAGVSPITVSRVANGSPAVVEETRERVLAAMEELGYRPNTAARALATGRFGTIGLITFNVSTHGNSSMIAGIATAAADAGFSVTLMTAAPRQGEIRGAYARLTEQAVHAQAGRAQAGRDAVLRESLHVIEPGGPHGRFFVFHSSFPPIGIILLDKCFRGDTLVQIAPCGQ